MMEAPWLVQTKETMPDQGSSGMRKVMDINSFTMCALNAWQPTCSWNAQVTTMENNCKLG